MERAVSVVHTTFEAAALAAAVWAEYDLPQPTACHLMQCGFNDHYLIATGEGEYVLRVYNHGWRTTEDIAYELAVLTHLETRGAPVCAPIARRDGSYQGSVPASEGPRAAVLFPCAAGPAPNLEDLDDVRACGRSMALIHQHSDDFTCKHRRFDLDLQHLIDRPAEVIVPFLSQRPSDIAFVRKVADQLCAGLGLLVDRLEWGYCHGDFPSGNVRMEGNGTARVFDFDCGGMGWRAYDLAVCRLGFGGSEATWEAFSEGYGQVRAFPEATDDALPWFLVTRQLWRTGLFAEAMSRFAGSAHVNDSFFDHNLGLLRERIGDHLPQLVAS